MKNNVYLTHYIACTNTQKHQFNINGPLYVLFIEDMNAKLYRERNKEKSTCILCSSPSRIYLRSDVIFFTHPKSQKTSTDFWGYKYLHIYDKIMSRYVLVKIAKSDFYFVEIQLRDFLCNEFLIKMYMYRLYLRNLYRFKDNEYLL